MTFDSGVNPQPPAFKSTSSFCISPACNLIGKCLITPPWLCYTLFQLCNIDLVFKLFASGSITGRNTPMVFYLSSPEYPHWYRVPSLLYQLILVCYSIIRKQRNHTVKSFIQWLDIQRNYNLASPSLQRSTPNPIPALQVWHSTCQYSLRHFLLYKPEVEAIKLSKPSGPKYLPSHRRHSWLPSSCKYTLYA